MHLYTEAVTPCMDLHGAAQGQDLDNRLRASTDFGWRLAHQENDLHASRELLVARRTHRVLSSMDTM